MSTVHGSPTGRTCACWTRGPFYREKPRLSALCLDKTFKGAKAGDLPIEQPTRLELIVKLGTAKAFGITIP